MKLLCNEWYERTYFYILDNYNIPRWSKQAAVIYDIRISRILTHWGRDKMDGISPTTFLKCIFLDENIWISIKISLKFVPYCLIDNMPSLVQIMAEAMMVYLIDAYIYASLGRR